MTKGRPGTEALRRGGSLCTLSLPYITVSFVVWCLPSALPAVPKLGLSLVLPAGLRTGLLSLELVIGFMSERTVPIKKMDLGLMCLLQVPE